MGKWQTMTGSMCSPFECRVRGARIKKGERPGEKMSRRCLVAGLRGYSKHPLFELCDVILLLKELADRIRDKHNSILRHVSPRALATKNHPSFVVWLYWPHFPHWLAHQSDNLRAHQDASKFLWVLGWSRTYWTLAVVSSPVHYAQASQEFCKDWVCQSRNGKWRQLEMCLFTTE